MAKPFLPAMCVIAFNYGRTSLLAFDCTAVNSCSAFRIVPKSAKRGASAKSLLKLDISRSSVNIQQNTAVSHLALNMVLGQGALCCYLMAIEPQRS